MSLRLTYEIDRASLDTFAAETVEKIGNAIQKAVRDTTEAAKKASRAEIAQAGFSSKWQNTLTAKYYQEGTPELAGFIYHKIDYAGVFQFGSTHSAAHGGLLWLPIEENLPAKIGRTEHFSPKQFVQSGGKLYSGFSSSGTPTLFERGSRKPLFVGVSVVTIPQKFDVIGAAQKEMDKMPSRYFDALDLKD